MKNYKVTGICMVPYEAEIYVEAESPEEAIVKAEKASTAERMLYYAIIPNSQDESSVHSFSPSQVEEI